jgi:TPR repeat protein
MGGDIPKTPMDVSQERSVYPPKEIEGRRLQLLDGPLVNLPQDILIEKQYRQYLSRAPEDTTGLPYLCNAAYGGHSNAQIEVGRHYAQGIDGFPSDLRRAFVWYSLANMLGSDMHLQLVTQKMTPDEIVEAKKLLADWKPGQCERDLMSAVYGN